MRGSALGLALGAVALLPCALGAQRPAPTPPPAPPPGPAALTVPHPIPPVPGTPGVARDLYQQLTPPSTPRNLFFPGFVYGPYGPYPPWLYLDSGYGTGLLPMAPPTPATRIPQGTLWFDSSPADAQVFVDGTYVGVVGDFGVTGRAVALDQGLHRIDLRAAGFAPLSFDVNIVANQNTRYRGDLQRVAAVPTAGVAGSVGAAVHKPTYVIPNCYAGDRPPVRPLRAGCDLSKMIVRKP